MSDSEMLHVIKSMLVAINDAIAQKQRYIRFALEGSTPVVTSQAIQRVLYSKGFITFIVFDPSGREMLYIDLSRLAKI